MRKKKGAEPEILSLNFLTSLPFLTGSLTVPKPQRKRKEKKNKKRKKEKNKKTNKKTKKKIKKTKKLFPSADPEGGVRDAPRHLAE
jgi:hypothetical protein